MLGLYTAKRRRAAFAIATAGTLIGIGAGAAIAATPHAESSASAINAKAPGAGGTALLTQVFGPVLDGGTCTATWDGGADSAGTGTCGDGLSLGTPQSPIAYTQTATAGSPAHSEAESTTGPVGLPGLAAIDLTNILDGLQGSDTSDVLDGLLPAVADLLETALDTLGLTTVLDDALAQIIGALDDQLDVTIAVGAVEAQCSADPNTASGNGTVTGIEGVVSLPTGDTVPLTIETDTAPNSKLVGSVPDLAQQIYDDLASSLLDETGPLAPVFNGLGNALDQNLRDGITALLTALEGPLDSLADGLAPLVEGTVNEQYNGPGMNQGGVDDFEGQTPPDNGEITVTGLDLILLQETPLEGHLELAKVNCGLNTAGGTATPTPTPTDPQDDGDDSDDGDGDDGDDSDDGDGPKSVDSGLNDGGNLGALAITGLLAASTLVGSAARQRLLLER